MSARPEMTEEKLHAFIDGELDPAEEAEIARLVAQNGAWARKVAGFRADKAALSRLFGPVATEPLPQEWIARIEAASRPGRAAGLSPWLAIAASLVIVFVSMLYMRPALQGADDAIVREAIAARNHALAPSEAIDARTPDQVHAIDRRMAALLNMRLRAPDLSRMGYRLAGMRAFDDVPGGRAVELLYRGAGNRDVTIYVRRPNSAVRFDQFKRDGLRVCVWQDEVLGTVIAGTMSAAEMQRIASLAYTGLET